MLPLMGSYGLYKLIIRFNTPRDADLYKGWVDEIAINRSFYILLAVLLAAGTALLWERNRSQADSGRVRGTKPLQEKLKRPRGCLMTGQTLRVLGWYNLKLTAHYSWLMSIALLCSVHLFMDPQLMEWGDVAKLGEQLISFLGLIVYPHLAMLEEGGIGEVLYAKKVRHHPIFLFRWLSTTLFVFLIIAVFSPAFICAERTLTFGR